MSLSHDHTTIHQAYHYYYIWHDLMLMKLDLVWRQGLLWAYYYITLAYVMYYNKLREKSSEPRYSAYFYGRSRQEYLGIENDRWILSVEHDVWNLSGYISGLDNNDFLCFVGHLFWYDICFTLLMICLD